MAKQKPIAHQSLTTLSPKVEQVRTHIRTHCQSENLIRGLLESLDLNENEFNEVFKSGYQYKKTKKKIPANAKDCLRTIVGAHLHHLLCLSKFKELKEKLKSKRMQQKEIKTIVESRPELAFQVFDFSKTITPEQALTLLIDLEKKTGELEENIFNTLTEHETNVADFSVKRDNLIKDLAEGIKSNGHALSSKELSHMFKAVSELTV